MNFSLLCCFLLALFYYDSSSFTKLNEASLIFSTAFMDHNLLHADTSQQVNQSKATNISDIGNLPSSIHCADEVQVDETSAAFNKENVNCVQGFINTCSQIDVYLIYSTGSMSLKILGLINGSCQIDIVHEVERDSNSYTCKIPTSRLIVWESWRSGDGLNAFRDVLDLCSPK
jgi:hypothetical protein